MATRRHGGGGLPLLARKALLWSAAALISLFILALLGYAQLLSWLQGEGFRSALEKELANKAQATSAEVAGTLGIEANRVSLQGITLARPALVQGLEARNIHAELVRAALLDKELHLTRLMVEEGTLTLDADQSGEELPPVRKKATGFLSGFAPTSARLDRFECKDFHANLRFGGRDFALADSSLTARPAPRQGKGAWELRLSNGRLHTPLPILGNSSLKTATLTLGNKSMALSDARLMLSPGELIINAVREQDKGNWSADIRTNSMDISRLIGEDWKKRLSGMLYGRLRADGSAEGLQRAEGRLSLQQGVLEALPILENLPVGDSYPYRSLRLDKATAQLSYPHADAARNIRQAWLLDKIDIRAQGGWLRVQGHALVDADGSLGGTLVIGLPERVAASLAPAGSTLYQSLFNATGEEGYLWLRMNLSGTLSAPQEDLSVRLTTLLSKALPQATDTLRQLLPTTSPKPPTAPAAEGEAPSPGSLLEEAGEAAGDIIGTGLRSIF